MALRWLQLVVAVISPFACDASLPNFTLADSCQKDNECQVGGRTCCSGRTHGTLRCGVSFCEPMCEKAVNFVIDKLAEYGCAEIIPEGDVFCEAIGFGPEDPLADLCAAIVTTGCPIIAKLVAKNIKDPKQICSEIGLCKDTGSSCGCLADGACADSTGDCCSGRRHRTAACGADFRCGCIADGTCAGVDGVNGCCSGTSHRTAACGSNIRCGVSPSPGPSPGHCDDVAPDTKHTCAQQKDWGKCGESWMKGHCCKTCFNCKSGCGGLDKDIVV